MTAEVSYAWAGSPAGWNMIGRLPPGVWGNVRRWRTTASLAPSSWASEATNSVGAGAIYSSLRAGRSDCRRSKWDANEGWRRSPPPYPGDSMEHYRDSPGECGHLVGKLLQVPQGTDGKAAGALTIGVVGCTDKKGDHFRQGARAGKGTVGQPLAQFSQDRSEDTSAGGLASTQPTVCLTAHA